MNEIKVGDKVKFIDRSYNIAYFGSIGHVISINHAGQPLVTVEFTHGGLADGEEYEFFDYRLEKFSPCPMGGIHETG